MKIINSLKRIFLSSNEDMTNVLPEKEFTELKLPVKRILDNYDPYKKTIVVIDDSRGIVSIVEDFIKDAEDKGYINLNDYNILTFYDDCAPFIMKETLRKIDPDVEFAIIDIVLPGKISENGIFVRMDGIDVAEVLHNEFGCNNFIFFTGNVVSEYVDYMKNKILRFNKIFNKNIEDFIVFKGDINGDKVVEKFGQLFKKEKFTA